MPSVQKGLTVVDLLALVSKSVFVKEAGGLGVGDVWPATRYASTGAGLRALADGGDLYLVTVRPDDVLWLVAVLRRPTFDGSGWVSAPNDVPITDVTARLAGVRLLNGAGISAAPGRLGMSLQTPRKLAATDPAVLLGTTTPSAPSGPAATDGPEVPAPWQAVLGLMARSPGKAVKEAKKLAKALGATEAARRLLDVVADAALAVAVAGGGRATGAARPASAEAFSASRAVARKLGAAPDLERFARFADAGALSADDLAVLVADLRKLKRDDDLVAMCARAVVGGTVPNGKLLTAVDKAGPAIVAAVWERWITQAPSAFDKVDTEAFGGLSAGIGGWAGRSEAGRAWLLAYQPLHRYRAGTWLGVLGASGVASTITDPQVAAAFLTDVALLLDDAAGRGRDELAVLADAAATLAPLVREAGLTVPGTDPTAPHGLLCVEVLDTLLGAGVPLALPALEDADRYELPMFLWKDGRYPAELDLRHLLADPVLNAAMVANVLHHLKDGANRAGTLDCVAKFAATPGSEPVLQAVVDLVAEIAERGTLGTVEGHIKLLQALCRPEILDAAPALRGIFTDLDPVELLDRQLRAGLLDEWGWPALDAAPVTGPGTKHSGAYPYLCRWDPETGRLDVIGPEGVVLEGHYAPDSHLDHPREMRYIAGDVLLDPPGRWLVAGERGHCWVGSRYGTDVAVADGLVTANGLIRPGSDDVRVRKLRNGDLHTDGATVWLAQYESVVGADGLGWESDSSREVSPERLTDQARRGEAKVVVLGPDGTPGAPALPPWFAQRLPGDGTLLCFGNSYLVAVPPGSEASPVGAADGVGGLMVTWHPERGVEVERADGVRHATGDLSVPVAVLDVPGGDGHHVVHLNRYGRTVFADGIPITPAQEDWAPHHWSSPLAEAGPRWWHLLRLRDPQGTAALRNLGPDVARRLFDAARGAVPDGSPGDRPSTVTTFHDMKIVHTPAPKGVDAAAWPAVVDAVAAAIPEITHPELRAAVVRMAIHAVTVEGWIHFVHERAATVTTGPRSQLTNRRAAAFGDLVGFDATRWWNRPEARLGEQLHDVGEFLAGDLEGTDDEPVLRVPAPSDLPWEHLAARLPEVLWRVLAAGTPARQRTRLVNLLKTWLATPLADGPLHLAELTLPGGLLLDADTPVRLAAWRSRWFLRYLGPEGDRVRVTGLTLGELALPPGADDVRVRLCPLGRDAVEQALSLLAERGPVPASGEAAAALAERTGLLVPTAGLLWTAAGEPWESARTVRASLGLSAPELKAGMDELGRFDLARAYARCWPQDPATLYDGVVPDGLVDGWNEAFGRRPPVDLDWVLQAMADLPSAGRGVAADVRVVHRPDRFPMVTRDEVWVVRPFDRFTGWSGRYAVPPGWPKHARMGREPRWPSTEEAFCGYVLRHLLPYLAWAYAELPGGHPLRDGAGRLAGRLRERLTNPDLLILAGIVDLRAASERFADIATAALGPAYEAADGGESAAGVDRGDLVVTWAAEEPDGVFVALRPAGVGEETVLLTALRDLGVLPGGPFTARTTYDVRAWLVFASAPFQALCDELIAGDLPDGRYVADPRVAVPHLVAGTAAGHGLDEAAATLLLQLSVLADPTAARVCRLNGWTRKEHDAAATVLRQAGLAVEAVHGRSSRRLWLPGPVVPGTAPARPVEEVKVGLYTFAPTGGYPLGQQLPLRPMADLFCTVPTTSSSVT